MASASPQTGRGKGSGSAVIHVLSEGSSPTSVTPRCNVLHQVASPTSADGGEGVGDWLAASCGCGVDRHVLRTAVACGAVVVDGPIDGPPYAVLQRPAAQRIGVVPRDVVGSHRHQHALTLIGPWHNDVGTRTPLENINRVLHRTVLEFGVGLLGVETSVGSDDHSIAGRDG